MSRRTVLARRRFEQAGSLYAAVGTIPGTDSSTTKAAKDDTHKRLSAIANLIYKGQS